MLTSLRMSELFPHAAKSLQKDAARAAQCGSAVYLLMNAFNDILASAKLIRLGGRARVIRVSHAFIFVYKYL